MPYRQVDDLLDALRRFHEGTRQYYAANSQRSDDPRLTRLLEDLESQERALSGVIDRASEGADSAPSRTWLQFDVDQPLRELLDEQREAGVDGTIEQVVERAVRFDRALEAVYERLATSQAGHRVRDLFAELAAMQRSRLREHALRGLDTDI